jgi:hypothetical protein
VITLSPGSRSHVTDIVEGEDVVGGGDDQGRGAVRVKGDGGDGGRALGQAPVQS